MPSLYSAPTADFVTSSLSGALTAGATSGTIATGLDIPATKGILQINYDSVIAVGTDNGPETIYYTAYNTGTGAISGLTRGIAGTTGVAHDNGATVQCGPSSLYISDYSDWINPLETWTYASATTITVPTDATTKYAVGDKIRLKQGGAYKYFYITAVAATLLTITGGTDYTFTSATVTDNYFSKVVSPVGFPTNGFALSAFQNLVMHGREATIRGWGYGTYGGASPNVTVTVTLAKTLADAAYDLSVFPIGYKNAADPSTRVDTTLYDTQVWGIPVSTSQFTIQVHKVDGASPANTVRALYSWIVKGTI